MEAKPRAARPIAQALVQALAHAMGLVATSHWLDWAIQRAPGFEDSRLASHGAASFIGLADAAHRFLREAVLIGALEEILFRGLLFALLERLRGARFALIASALFFGLAHLDPHHAFVAFLLGLQLGLIRIAHGLPVAAFAHIANNGVALVLGAFAATPLPLGQDAPTVREAMSAAELSVLAIAALGSALACAALMQAARRAAAAPRGEGSALQSRADSDD